MSITTAVRPGLLTAKLSVIELVSWGALYYTFAVFLPAMEEELGISSAMLAIGFSTALLISGLAAPQVGSWIDRHGSRGLMVCAAMAGSCGMWWWSLAEGLPSYFAAWVLIGLGMAGTHYAPAFATVVRVIPEHSRQAILVITLVGALASTVFMPLAAMLAEPWGWRGAIRTIALTLAVVIIPLAATLPRRSNRDSEPVAPSLGTTSADREPQGFRLLALALMLADGASLAINVHLVVFLVEQGHPLATAAGIAGLAGAAKVGGRLATAAAGRISALQLMILSLFIQAGTLLLPILWSGSWAAVAMVAGFGAASGARTILRPAVLLEMCGTRGFGKNNGKLQLLTTLANASGPVGLGWIVAEIGWLKAWPLLALIVFASGILLFRLIPSSRPRSTAGELRTNKPRKTCIGKAVERPLLAKSPARAKT